MQAPETGEIVEATRTRIRGTCLNEGCECKDPRIVSRRRARFFAAMARRSGQTANRVVAVEAGWRIPSVQITELALPPSSLGPDRIDPALERESTVPNEPVGRHPAREGTPQ